MKRVALMIAVLSIAACKGGRSNYSQDADTGAAAPATKLDSSMNAHPDSTPGVSHPTAAGVPAGDTLAAHGQPAGPAAGAAGASASQQRKRP